MTAMTSFMRPPKFCRPYRRYAEKLSDSFAARAGGRIKLWADQDNMTLLSGRRKGIRERRGSFSPLCVSRRRSPVVGRPFPQQSLLRDGGHQRAVAGEDQAAGK